VYEHGDLILAAGPGDVRNVNVNRRAHIVMSQAVVAIHFEFHHPAVDPDPYAPIVDRADRLALRHHLSELAGKEPTAPKFF
jgi:hypothetical protein